MPYIITSFACFLDPIVFYFVSKYTRMKKNIISLCASLHLSFVFSQVGINTTTPKTTFDVNAKRDPSGAIVDNNQLVGFQAPRMSRLELTNNTASYDLEQKGALIFITDISGGTAIGQRINITLANNYYYFDGTVWQRIADSNLYKDNGTLISNRTVAQADKTLAFTNTATTGTSHFTVDGTTLNVDAVNDRVGINNAVPTAKLDVIGNATTAPIRARNMEKSENTTLANKPKLSPVMIDDNGVMVRQFSIADQGNSYYFDGANLALQNGGTATVVTNITAGSVVKFSFMTNFSFGNSRSGIIYAQVSFTIYSGFKVSDDWTHSGNSTPSNTVTLSGVGTQTLRFSDASPRSMELKYDPATQSITVTKIGDGDLNLQILEGVKYR